VADIPAHENVPSKPITVTFKSAKQISGLGLTTLWGLAKDGRLQVVRVAGRTLIVYDSLERLLTPSESLAVPRRPGRPPRVRVDDGVAP
jgi:hypothetical protein